MKKTFAILSFVFGLSLFAKSVHASTPQSTFFAGFNNNQITTGTYSISDQGVVYDPVGKIDSGMRLSKGLPNSLAGKFVLYDSNIIDPRHGSVAFWIKINVSTPSGGPAEIFTLYPGPPIINGEFTPSLPDPDNAGALLPGRVDFTVTMSNAAQSVGTGGFNFLAGVWHHVVWAWQGTHHSVYLDGNLTSDVVLNSPWPAQVLPPFYVGMNALGVQDITIDEFGIYNFFFSPAEAQAAFNKSTSGPIAPIGTHSTNVSAQWGPGTGKVDVTVACGNDVDSAVATGAVHLLNGTQEIATGSISDLNKGFGECLLDAGGSLAAGTYHVSIDLLDSNGALLSTVLSADYVVPVTSWLGNNLGISVNQVQPPWTPIKVSGLQLKVTDRVYDLTDGFGLPTQITSLNQNLLSKPAEIDIDGGAGVFHLIPQSLQINSPTHDDKVTWTGEAIGNGIRAHIDGSLEYDGLMLINLTLSPTAGPVSIDSMQLQTALPANRALYMNTSTDQPYWWYTSKMTVPTTAGRFWSNLDQRAYKSVFLPSMVLSDNDRGLEWFAENEGGWQVDEAQYMQEFIVDTNGDVRLQCNLANRHFTLSKPITMTFGYMATPVKPLPADWRAGRFGAAGGASAFPKNDLDVYWEWQSHGDSDTFRTFTLIPKKIDVYKTAIQPIRDEGRKVVPYTDAHVLIGSGGDPYSALDPIQAETENDGWTALYTKGSNDYWAYWVNQAMDQNAYDGLYIDESWPIASTALISGGGFIRPDGTHGPGYTLLACRERLKRLRQIMLNHGKRPVIWLHTTGQMYPHAWGFADVASDGESFMFNNPTDPDWIDVWGSEKNLAWIMSVSRAQKFGLIPAFLNYIKFWYVPDAYAKAMRAYHGLLQLMDLHPVESDETIATIRKNFGITAPDVVFHGFWEPTAVRVFGDKVKCSYYTRNNSSLLVITNLGEAETNNVKLLNLDPSVSPTVIDAETNQPIPVSNRVFPLSIPRHDFRMIQVTGVNLVAETEPPTTPTGLTATPKSSSQIYLAWNASSDNVGVAGYTIMRGTTTVGTSTTNSFIDTGLSPLTLYTYTVKAFDESNNISLPSNPASATTPAFDPNKEKFPSLVGSPTGGVDVGITFTLDKPANVSVKVYGRHGILIRNLPSQDYLPGDNTILWDGRNNAGEKVASGTYVVVITPDGQKPIKQKVVVVR